MSIERLTTLIRPPDSPSEVGSPEGWAAAEQELGVELPHDYREFVLTYGSGLFAGLYVVYNPLAASPLIRLKSQVEKVCATERQLRLFPRPNAVRYPIFPEEGGLFPWGRDENGNYYHWLTEGAPAEWVVVENSVRGKGHRRHDCSMTEFLVGILEGRIEPLASGYSRPDHFVFQPYPSGKRPWWRVWG